MNTGRVKRAQASVASVPVERLRAHPRNVRTDLGDLRELADSIRNEGVLVPLMAEQRGAVLRLLHGHRRWAAAKLAGLARVPVVIVPQHTDDQALALMLAENTRRAELSIPDRRRAIMQLHDEFGHTYTEIARQLGVTVATIYNWRGVQATAPAAAAAGGPRASRAVRRPRKPQPPRIQARAVHELLHRWDGQAPGELLAELRGWLGDWQPEGSKGDG